MFLFAILFSLAYFACSLCCETQVTVDLGTICGKHESINGVKINEFYGIPYAEAPIGDRRFKIAKPYSTKYNGTLDGTKLPHVCVQPPLSPTAGYLAEMNEDCLYLNVWTPADLSSSSGELKPVMVFIHGGGFTAGGISRTKYLAGGLASIGDVVTVAMNYRLGIFGFLFGDPKDAPGNVGLHDQALALQWVHDNIEKFGGNKNQVTIFGQSAGSKSTSLQVMSPISTNFNRAILMSGIGLENLNVESQQSAYAKTIAAAKLLNCNVDNDSRAAILTCLRSKTPQDLLKAQTSAEIRRMSKQATLAAFMPIYGEAFIPIKPHEIWKQQQFKPNVSVIVGDVPNEATAMLSILKPFFNASLSYKQNMINMFNLVKPYMNVSTDELVKFYFNGITDDFSEEAKLRYYDVLGDFHYKCASVYFAEEYSKMNDVWHYLFNYKLTGADKVSSCTTVGTCHGSDVPLALASATDPENVAVAREWIKLTAEFARTGKASWPQFTRNGEGVLMRNFYNFMGSEHNSTVQLGYREQACNLLKPMILSTSA